MAIDQQPKAQIEMRTSRGGETKAYIAGTRVSVQNVYVCHELQGLSPDEVITAYPQLTLAQIHAALSYYYQHPNEIRDQLRREQEFASAIEKSQGSTQYTQLRDAMMAAKDGGNPVSS